MTTTLTKTRDISPRQVCFPYGDYKATAYIQEISNGSCAVYRVYLEVSGGDFDLESTVGYFFSMNEAVTCFNAEALGNHATVECESCGRYVPDGEINPGGDMQTINGPRAYPDTCSYCR